MTSEDSAVYPLLHHIIKYVQISFETMVPPLGHKSMRPV